MFNIIILEYKNFTICAIGRFIFTNKFTNIFQKKNRQITWLLYKRKF